MVPAEFMTVAVSMLTDALSQLLYFGNEFFTCHPIKVGVHNVLSTKSLVRGADRNCGFYELMRISSISERLASW